MRAWWCPAISCRWPHPAWWPGPQVDVESGIAVLHQAAARSGPGPLGLRFVQVRHPRPCARAARPLLRDLHLASREAIRSWPPQGEDFGLVSKGLLMLCKDAHALDEEAAHGRHRPARWACRPRCSMPRPPPRLDPGITMDIAGAVHFPKDCHLDTRALPRGAATPGRRTRRASSSGTPGRGLRRDGRRLRAVAHPPARSRPTSSCSAAGSGRTG